MIRQRKRFLAFKQKELRNAVPSAGQRLSLRRGAQRGARTQGEDVGATGPSHMVLLDGLVERGLAQQQEAEANPNGQQPGHGEGRVCGTAHRRRENK